ncbi:MAG TPA: hypothetical protein VIQ80_02830 [Candidatus Saccharimonadales bacterium]
MSETDEEVKQRPFMPLEGRKLIAVTALGAVIGLVVWELALVLTKYVFNAWLCHDTSASCTNAPQYGEAVASILGGIVALFFLVRLQIFRPLLVVIAVVASLWGIVTKAEALPWYGVGLSAILLYMFAYIAFTWIARLKAFWLVLATMVVLVIAIRLLLNY